MSHNYPYRTTLPHMLDHRAHGPGDSCHPSGNCLYASQYSSSTSATRCSVMPQENVLSLLRSCGLEPEDLGRLAELPEDVLTVESLPHILQQMKDKKGVIKSYPSASTSSSASSFHYCSTSQPTIKVEELCSQPVQYPLISSTHPPPEHGQEHWGTPRTSSSVRAGPPLSSSSSSGCMVDMDLRAVYSKSDPCPTSSPIGQRLGSSHFFNSGPTDRQVPYHCPTPLLPQHPTNINGGHHQKLWSTSSRSNQPSFAIPSLKQALDFHGTPQSVFPYTCSLCDITVLSEKVWTQHINSTLHADRQLNLLQEFPKWDCRVTTIGSDGGQSQSRDTKANHSQGETQPSKNSQKKVKGKVVCVKFPPQSVDETYLRKLTEPFGKILKILMFPSLAFVELGSVDQANDLVKFHVNYPPTVNGSQIEFSISSTFSFLQSSQVVSFIPAPEGEDGCSDLISIVKRFGMPLYTMFLPSKAYVEMKTVTEAQKLVEYYSANVLRISNDSIRVSFSGEYKSLARLSSARRYEEHPASRSTKRARTRSRSRGKRTRTRSRSRDKKARTRSKSREKYEKVHRTRIQSADNMEKKTRTRSRSRDKSNTEKQTRPCYISRSRSRSRSQDDAIEIFNNNQEARSRPIDLSGSDKRTTTRSWSCFQDETRSPSKTETKSNSQETFEQPLESATDKPAPVVQSKPKGEDVTMMEEENDEEDDKGLSVNSDIEGMEVIAEDGEQLVDEDNEELEKEEEHGEEEDEEGHFVAVNTQPSETGEEEKDVEKEEEVEKDEEKEEKVEKEEEVEKDEEVMKDKNPDAEAETEAEEEKGESQVTCLEEEDEAFPMDPENFITLDELGEDECTELSDEAAVVHESDSDSSRVVYIRNLPPRFYSDADFLNVLRDCGTAVRYLLIRGRQEGFVEMSTPSEATKAARELNAKPTFLNKSKLEFIVSHKYHRLTCGWTLKSEAYSESRRGWRREASKRSPEKESRREPAARNSPVYEFRKTSEEESASQETSYLKETSAETQQRIESPEVKTQKKTESLDAETRQKTKSPGVEISTTSKKEVPPISGAPQDKTQLNRSPESKKVKEDKDKSLLQTDLRSVPPDNEKNGSLRETEDEKLPNGLMKDKQVKLTEAECEEDFYNVQTSFNPIGVEFVRPVVGYFCNLCQLIYADEDKAKQEHCSTLEHYRRYQEKTGKDPWMS